MRTMPKTVLTRHRGLLIGVVVVAAVLWALGRLAVLYADYLWFDTMGFAAVFKTEVSAKLALGLGVFVGTALWLGGHCYLAAKLAPMHSFQIRGLPWVISGMQLKRLTVFATSAFVLLMSYGFAQAAVARWFEVLQFMNRATFHWQDPVLGHDAGFYVFTLPVLLNLKMYAIAMAGLGAIGATAVYFIGGAIGWPYARMTRAATIHLGALVSLLLVGVGFGYWLDRYDLMLSPHGIVFGAGYVDVHVRMPVYFGMAIASGVAALLVLLGSLKLRAAVAYLAVFGLVAAHIIAVWSYPSFSQRFDVEPNELERETSFLKNNIEGTRFAYGLDDVEVRPYAATGKLSLEEVVQVTGTIDNVRIWDWRVLLSTYNQIEALRPYYPFNDVDVDRYVVDGRSRQVTLAVRELETSLLNPDSQTWVNLHLLYTHGYGLCMSPVNAVTPEGLPELWIRNIPPQSAVGLPLTRPEIYFGELTRDYIFVRTTQKEFDYPLGDENRYNQYDGPAGVPIHTMLRKLLFAYYFRDWNILLTDCFTPKTCVLWDRQVLRRARKLAPFLEFDRDPYPVIYDGRILWILDAYTQTDRFPYATRSPQWRRSPNYIRNSVKAVIDAYDGTVTFYVVDPADPLALAARGIFPDLFKDLADMPIPLRAHLRYPNDLFEVLAERYLAYHMTDPRIFYNKEDLWQRPTHIFEGETQPLAAYYFIMNLPAELRPEYILMLPFTPARKENMVGWMAGRSDGEDYGKLLVYTFPKARLIFGPNQVEARINQHDQISPLLTLWNQQGSRVVRGNILVIPVGDSILYVEPLYLKSENAAIPELKRVIVSYQDRIAMRNTLPEALSAVFSGAAGEPLPDVLAPAMPPLPDVPSDRRKRALELFEKGQDQMRKGDWAGYGKTMEELGKLLHESPPEPKPQ